MAHRSLTLLPHTGADGFKQTAYGKKIRLHPIATSWTRLLWTHANLLIKAEAYTLTTEFSEQRSDAAWQALLLGAHIGITIGSQTLV